MPRREATCDFYLQQTPTCGIPYWDTGAPGSRTWTSFDRPADPFNAYEPVDSSAAAIAAQGLLRLDATCSVAAKLSRQSILASRPDRASHAAAGALPQPAHGSPRPAVSYGHHRPRGWDHIPPGAVLPMANPACGATIISWKLRLTSSGSPGRNRTTRSLARFADALTKRRTTPRFKNVIREGKAPAELRITAHPARQEPRPPGFEIRSDVADRWIPYPKPTPTKRL